MQRVPSLAKLTLEALTLLLPQELVKQLATTACERYVIYAVSDAGWGFNGCFSSRSIAQQACKDVSDDPVRPMLTEWTLSTMHTRDYVYVCESGTVQLHHVTNSFEGMKLFVTQLMQLESSGRVQCGGDDTRRVYRAPVMDSVVEQDYADPFWDWVEFCSLEQEPKQLL